jgi:hypothetical protein
MFSSSGRVLSPSLPNWPHLRTPPSTWPISLSYRLQMIQTHAWEAPKDISLRPRWTKFLPFGTGLVTGCENIFRLVEGYGTDILLCSQPDCHRLSHQFWADLDEKRNSIKTQIVFGDADTILGVSSAPPNRCRSGRKIQTSCCILIDSQIYRQPSRHCTTQGCA